jgi:hypothetical protein
MTGPKWDNEAWQQIADYELFWAPFDARFDVRGPWDAAIRHCPTDHTMRSLLAAVAAFRGRTDLASVLEDLDLSDVPTA